MYVTIIVAFFAHVRTQHLLCGLRVRTQHLVLPNYVRAGQIVGCVAAVFALPSIDETKQIFALPSVDGVLLVDAY